MQNKTFYEVIEAFIADQDIFDISKKAYRQWLRPFQIWVLQNDKNPYTLKVSDFNEYKRSIVGRLSDKTVNCYLTVVRMLYRWMDANAIAANYAIHIRLNRLNKPYRKHALTVEQVTALINSCDNTPTGTRTRAIIELMVRNGLRAVEVSKMEWKDIKRDSSIIDMPLYVFVQGKGRYTKDATIPLCDETYTFLKSQRINEDSTFVFHTKTAKQLKAKYISEIINRQMDKIGMKSATITSHSLRHTTAIMTWLKTNDIRTTKSVLRHSSIKTTEIYLNAIQTDNESINTALRSIGNDITEAIKRSQNPNKSTKD